MRNIAASSRSLHRAAHQALVGLVALLLGVPLAMAGPCAAPPPEAVSVIYASQSNSALEDDFEDGLLERHWSLKHILPGSHAYTDKIVSQGRQALLITVH